MPDTEYICSKCLFELMNCFPEACGIVFSMLSDRAFSIGSLNVQALLKAHKQTPVQSRETSLITFPSNSNLLLQLCLYRVKVKGKGVLEAVTSVALLW